MSDMKRTKTAFTKSELLLVTDTSLSNAQVAELTGRLLSTIYAKRLKLGLIQPARMPWTTKDDNYLVANIHKEKYAEIGEHLGRSVNAVTVRVQVLGLSNHGNSARKFTKADLDLIKNMTLNNAQVAKILGRTPQSIWSKRNKLGLYVTDEENSD